MSIILNKKILILDDEKNILNALKRVLHSEKFEVDITSTQTEALDLLKKKYAVIISDYNMPGMNGVEFLEQAKKIAKDTYRIILTGYADLNTSLDAINKSGVYKFLLKPWDNDQLVQTVKEAVDLFNLAEENKRLNQVVEQQNAELRDLNLGLENKVKERTSEITKLNKKIEQSFLGSIRMMSSLLEASSNIIGGHSKRVAILAGNIAKGMGVTGNELLNIQVAAFLHDIGKIGLPENIVKRDEESLSEGELQVYKKHVLRGEALIGPVSGMHEVAIIVRQHHEKYDGTGFPDRLTGETITLGARIIHLADFYDKALNSKTNIEITTLKNVIKTIQSKSGAAFDPRVFESFASYIQTHLKQATNDDIEVEIKIDDLEFGMILSRPIILASGRQLLPKDSKIKEGFLEKIIKFNSYDPIIEGIFIYRRKADPKIIKEVELDFLKGDFDDK